MKSSRWLWLLSAFVLAVCVPGFVAVGCGPKEKFCINAKDDGYRCLPQLDARPETDGYDGPEPERGATFVDADPPSSDGAPAASD